MYLMDEHFTSASGSLLKKCFNPTDVVGLHLSSGQPAWPEVRWYNR